MSRARRLAVGALLVGALAGVAPTFRRSPNVVLVVVDTLRADRLGAYGGTRGLTPFLDDLARRGTVFTNAYATSSWTAPSVASIFTSRLPSEHGVTRYDSRLGDAEVTLAEALRPPAHGRLRRILVRDYVTGGWSANLRLTTRFGWGQGFATWRALETLYKPRGDRLNRKALLWLERVRGRWFPRPVFLYLQYMEPHAPYEPPAPWAARFADRGAPFDAAAANAKVVGLEWGSVSKEEAAFLASLYDAEVASLDANLAALFAGLAERGVLDDAVVVVTADHGEEFLDHGLMEHGTSLYNETLRVPLIVLVPGQPGGRHVADDVSLLDLAPTLLELAGRPPEPRFEGRSLVPLLRGARADPAEVVAELPSSGSDILRTPAGVLHLARHWGAVVRWPLKLALRREPMAFFGRLELYDLSADPGEQRPLPLTGSPEVHGLLRRLREVKARVAHPSRAPAGTVPFDEHTRELLRSLGYVN